MASERGGGSKERRKLASMCRLEAFPLGLPSDHLDRSRQLTESRFHQRSEVPRMASERGGGSKERRKLASMCRLH